MDKNGIAVSVLNRKDPSVNYFREAVRKFAENCFSTVTLPLTEATCPMVGKSNMVSPGHQFDRLIIIADVDYCEETEFSETIVSRVYESLKNTQCIKFHLICLVPEPWKGSINNAVSPRYKYNNPDIQKSLLLLKPLEKAGALTRLNIFSGSFTADLKKRIVDLMNSETEFSSLEDFVSLIDWYPEALKRKIPPLPDSQPEESKAGSQDEKLLKDNKGPENSLKELSDTYGKSAIGEPELGSHNARAEFDKHFMISEQNLQGIDCEEVGKHAHNMKKTIFVRDFARNIADGTLAAIRENGSVKIIIIDDNSRPFKSEMAFLEKKWGFKLVYREDYKKILNELPKLAENGFDERFEIKNDEEVFFLVDLLLGKENSGCKIVKQLIRFKIQHGKKYDVFMFSRSTNTNDIQTALNEGACGYIFKERIFSIPYRICEILQGEEYDILEYIAPFQGLTRLPLKDIRKLKTTEFKDDPENRQWIRELPKADLHCHIGGAMDARITLELAINIVRDTVASFWLTGSFVYLNRYEYENAVLNVPEKLESLFVCGKLERLLELTKSVARSLKRGYNPKPGLKNILDETKNRIKKIAKNISGIETHQVSCLILIQLMALVEQEIYPNDEPSPALEDLLKKILNNNMPDPFKDIKINPIFEALISAPYREYSPEKIKCFKRKHPGNGLPFYILGGLFTGSAVLQTEQNLRRVAQYICKKSEDENVWYRELKITPKGLTKGNLSENRVLEIFKCEFKKYKTKNKFLLINIIVAGKRHGDKEDLGKNISLVIRDVGLEGEKFPETRVCGFDLVGQEIYNDPRVFRDGFRMLFEACVPLTIHAGEETEANKIWEAVYELNADRIGHGLSLMDIGRGNQALLNRLRDQKVCVELCPKSNFLTKGYLVQAHLEKNPADPEKDKPEYGDYPLKFFLKNELQVTINTDDPGFSGSFYRDDNSDGSEEKNFAGAWLSQEYLFANEMFKASSNSSGDGRYFSRWEILKLIKMGFKHSFLNAKDKRKLIREVDHKIYDFIIDSDY